MSEESCTEVKQELCQSCGKTFILQAHTIHVLGRPVMVRRQDYCLRCGYANIARLQMCCMRSYKEPFPRMKKDGRLPDIFLKAAHEQGYRD